MGPGLESEYSPHTSSCSLTREEHESEHEKSDSEQEKDATSPVTDTVVDILTQVLVDAVGEAGVVSATPEVTPEKKSKKSDDPAGQAKTKKAKVRCSKVSPAVVCLATARKEVATDKSKPTPKPAIQLAVTAKVAVSAAKPSQVQSATPSKPAALATAKPSNTPASQSTVAAKVSTTVPAAKTPAPGSTPKPTTFASTVRNSLQTKPSPGGNSVAMTRTNPRLTRSVTTIAPSPKPRVPARKTAAGLLITATPRPIKAQPPAKTPAPAVRPTTAPAVGAGSPKQQRISLVARQAKFAIQNQNPNRPNTRRLPGADKGKGLEMEQGEKGEECGAGCHHGSATSLSSCSSGRSWADCVRGGPGQRREAGLALHCSAEDLGAGGDRRKEVDSEGWCTVARRTRARVSPGQAPSKGARRSKYSAATRYRLPSSAMSMPSLALGYVQGEQEEEVTSARPHLEKSNSSASMAGREAREGGNTALGEVGEEELVDSTDPCAFIKKKKDEINHSKQKALKSLSGEGEEESKAKVEKSSSCPLAVTVEVHRAATPDPPQASLEDTVTTPSRTPDPEAEEREMAIAIAEMELSDLRRKVTETEQAELTDTDGDNDCGTDTETENYTTDTDTNDTRSEAGTTSDITSR